MGWREDCAVNDELVKENNPDQIFAIFVPVVVGRPFNGRNSARVTVVELHLPDERARLQAVRELHELGCAADTAEDYYAAMDGAQAFGATFGAMFFCLSMEQKMGYGRWLFSNRKVNLG